METQIVPTKYVHIIYRYWVREGFLFVQWSFQETYGINNGGRIFWKVKQGPYSPK